MKRKKIILLSITGTLLLCTICAAGETFLTAQMDRQSYHVYCELLTPGITFSEAEERLSSVGPYSISSADGNIYYVSFKDLITSISVGKMLLAFDSNKKLIGTAKKISLSDWSEVDCQYNR